MTSFGDELKAVGLRKPRAKVVYNSGNNEWYSPSGYTATARDVMDGIDLDPASTAKANEGVGANEGVRAAQIWTAMDDGLAQPWAGRVWLNPPYERGLVDKFCTKLAEEYEAGNVTEAIVLVNNSTDAAWFHELLKRASAVCFPQSRVRFWHPDGHVSNPQQGQAVLYLGRRQERSASRTGSARTGRHRFGGKVRSKTPHHSPLA